jgi:hypothetical protein
MKVVRMVRLGKKNPKTPRKTGRTIGGYSPAKLAERAKKRAGNVGKE